MRGGRSLAKLRAAATATVAAAGVLLAAPRAALAFDTIHEGEAALVGARSDETATLRAKVDLAIFPYPGGVEIWGGRINATRVEVGLARSWDPRDTDVTLQAVERARMQVVRWPHLHALGVERDLRLGTAIGGEAFGFYLPYVLHGTTGAATWGIATAGANLGYRFVRREDRARQDGHVGASTMTLRVDDQSTIGGRFQLRTYFDLSYTVVVGKFDGQRTLGFAHALVGSAGMALVVDVSGGEATRLVPKTDPGTGVVAYRTAVNEGSRLRIALFDVALEARPFDTLTNLGPVVHGQAGIIHDF